MEIRSDLDSKFEMQKNLSESLNKGCRFLCFKVSSGYTNVFWDLHNCCKLNKSQMREEPLESISRQNYMWKPPRQVMDLYTLLLYTDLFTPMYIYVFTPLFPSIFTAISTTCIVLCLNLCIHNWGFRDKEEKFHLLIIISFLFKTK